MHRLYENEDLTIFWDSDKCRHAKVCVHQSPTVFNKDKRPWIDAGAAPSAEIWKTVSQCPSGALTCIYNHDIRIIFGHNNIYRIDYIRPERNVLGREIEDLDISNS